VAGPSLLLHYKRRAEPAGRPTPPVKWRSCGRLRRRAPADGSPSRRRPPGS